MTPEQFEEIFDKVKAEAGCLETIRRYVLSVAIQGKLVSQNKLDEPAPELLKRILIVKSKNPSAAGRARRVDTEAFNHLKYEIPDSWKWTTLSEIGHVNPKIEADDHKTASFVEMASIFAEYGHSHLSEAKPWARIKTGFTRFCEGDVGLAKITPCFENGKSAIFTNLENGIGAGTTELLVVRPYLVEPRYVLAFLKSGFFIGNGIPLMTGTAGQKRVPSAYFSACPFPLPPLEEQKRIVAKVDELMALCDDLEVLAKSSFAHSDNFAESLFKSLIMERNNDLLSYMERFFKTLSNSHKKTGLLKKFIVNLALNGELIQENGTLEDIKKDLMQRTQVRHFCSPSMDEFTKLGILVPDNWAKMTVGDICDFYNGFAFPSQSYASQGIPIVRIGDLQNGSVTIKNAKKVSPEIASNLSDDIWIPNGSLLIAMSGATTGKTAINDSGEKCLLNQRVGRLKPKGISEKFFKIYFDHITERNLAISFGTAQPNLSKKQIMETPIAMPSIETQEQIVAEVEKLLVLCDELEASLNNEKAIKADLLKTLVA